MIVAAAGPEAALLPCVLTRVDLFGHLQFEWSAFRSLSTDRQIGMALGPISWSSIDRFASRHGLIRDDFDRLCNLIQAMDAAYRDYHETKSADAKR
jgi:hypothetical protein